MTEGAIEYAAAILLDAQEFYRDYGFDITDQLGILATIYNIGQPKVHAAYHAKHNSSPHQN